MARITHVCVSDLHAGADPSLATNVSGPKHSRDLSTPSPSSRAFGAALQSLLKEHNTDLFAAPTAPAENRPELILMGDLLDLAFADRGDAGKSYTSWLNCLTNGDSSLFADDTVFLPGNHDHSLWTGARMAAEAEAAGLGDIRGLPQFTQATDGKGFPSPLMTALNRQAGLHGDCIVRYPNYAVVSDDKSQVVAFHHGHFVDSTYRAMSTLQDALTGDKRRLSAKTLAEENANWIDFGWSSFGESSEICKTINDLYTGSENGNEARILRDRLARMLEEHLILGLPMGGDPSVHSALRKVLAVAIDSTFGAWSDSERYSKTEKLSPAGQKGLVAYIEEAVKPQLVDELGAAPKDLTFVFGHTHKPFVDQILCPTGKAVPTVNTGGWYLDNTRLDSRDGASVVLVDEHLNVVSIRYFAVPTNDVVMPTMVQLVSDPSDSAVAFKDQIQGYVNNDLPSWRALAQAGAVGYKLRQKRMFHLLADMDEDSAQTGDIL